MESGSEREVDLRSDTVTRPSEAMRAAMTRAEVGDDVFGDDPTVAELERRTAELCGHEAGLFVPSGTQSNLCGLMAHCERGDEYIVGQLAHTYKHEGGGAAVLGSIQPQPLEADALGRLDLQEVVATIKPDDHHFARTRLLALEDTFHGRSLPLDYIDEALEVATRHGLATHLDGARMFNAVVAEGVSAERIAGGFDSVSICLSKGLGAPVGSVLCSDGDRIDRARRWRKVLGGGMRQAGLLAAAGLYALDHNIERLAEDHHRAELLADRLRALAGEAAVEVATNMVFLRAGPAPDALVRTLERHGVIALASDPVRLVLHLDVDDAGLERAIAGFEEHYGGNL